MWDAIDIARDSSGGNCRRREFSFGSYSWREFGFYGGTTTIAFETVPVVLSGLKLGVSIDEQKRSLPATLMIVASFLAPRTDTAIHGIVT